jgi:AcrR family transcriptional regulator
MTDKPTDRRVRRTRHALENALISLILEKGYDAVTIEEITDRADLGRTTFYLHFRDKEELLMTAIDTMIEDFLVQHDTQPLTKQKILQNTQPGPERFTQYGHLIKQIFVHAQENADLYKVMLRGEGSRKAIQRLTEISKHEFLRRMRNYPDLQSKVPLDVLAVHFTGSILELVTWWLEENKPYSIDEMVSYFQQMFVFGALDTVHLAEIRPLL